MSVIKYYPEDVDRDVGSLGIKLPMNSFAGGSKRGIFNMSYTTEEQSISNYIMLLLTRKGERYMQPKFGIGIQEKLFEPKTELLRMDIEREIREQSNFWLPYINNHRIHVNIDTNDAALGSEAAAGIVISIVFSVTEGGANRTITIFGGENGRVNINVS